VLGIAEIVAIVAPRKPIPPRSLRGTEEIAGTIVLYATRRD
jgi:hypothetical protein